MSERDFQAACVAYQAGQYALSAEILQSLPQTAEARTWLARIAIQQGSLDSAEVLLSDICSAETTPALAWTVLAGLRLRQQRPEDARVAAMQAVAQAPEAPEGWLMASQIHGLLGRPDLALDYARLAVTREGAPAEAFAQVGTLLAQQGKADEAIPYLEQALQQKPGLLGAQLVRGELAYRAGAFGRAVQAFEQAVRLAPQQGFCWQQLGAALIECERLPEALATLQKALALTPGDRYTVRLFALALLRHGHYRQAEALLGQLLADTPKDLDALRILAAVHVETERSNSAIELYRHCLAQDAAHPDTLAALAEQLARKGQFAEALPMVQQASALAPDSSRVWHAVANVSKDAGDMVTSVAAYRQVLSRTPKPAFHSNLLLALQYAGGVSREEVRAAHFEYGQRFEAPLRDCRGGYSNTAVVGRPLRVGYVSADFCNHSVSYFAEPLLANHDRSLCSVICYHNRPVEDHVTARFRGHADEFYNVSALTDEQLAAKVRSDRIDILVDLTGHTAKNRLMTFARKPAPVQVTWLGHPNTTGLTAMDWRFTDVACDPEGSEVWYTERLWRLPDVFCCYRPMIRHPERRHDAAYQPGPSPCLKQGYMTFGCCNNYAKLTDEVIALWSRLLHQVPRSRLLLEAMGLGEGYLRERLLERFEKHGIAAERLDLRNRQGEQQYLLYHEIDIALDPFPANGGTTSCDLLWMGVPLVTLRGEQFVSRMGSSLVGVVGHPEWIAGNEDEYIGIASHLASDPAALDGIRQQLRGEVEASPLMDEPRFARNVEQAYQQFWKLWTEV